VNICGLNFSNTRRTDNINMLISLQNTVDFLRFFAYIVLFSKEGNHFALSAWRPLCVGNDRE
jgi:hypothetical protein